MATKYNQIGSLIELLRKLSEKNIHDLHTLDDIRSFRNGFQNSLNLIKLKNKEFLLKDINNLESEYKNLSLELDRSIKERGEILKKEREEIGPKITALESPKNALAALIDWFKKRRLLKRRLVLESHFEEEIKRPLYALIHQVDSLKQDFEDKKSNSDRWVDSLSETEVNRAKFVLSVLDTNKYLFYGAEGEERALEELIKLPESYAVINDYRRKFYQPIYDRKNDDRIYSIQIDHIVVGPTGIFLIETKNWSQESVESRDLFSPVKQLRRSSFAMFVLLNQAIENGELNAFTRNWGEQKISPKNIILLMNHKPVEEFQYVKILSLAEINKHITYGNTIFPKIETDALVNYLNHAN